MTDIATPTAPRTPSDRHGDWMQTYTGRMFWPLDPRVADIDIQDIAHALACQNRFAGHTREPYSVAEHCVRAARFVASSAGWVPMGAERPFLTRLALATLLHDASEAYLVDVPRPVKRSLIGYSEAETKLQNIINLWAGLPVGAHHWNAVKHADEVLLATEARDLLGPHPAPWTLSTAPMREKITPRRWADVERDFLGLYTTLTAMLDAHPLPAHAHFHHCPECYEKVPCGMECFIADTSDGLPMGFHERCSECVPKVEREPQPAEPTNPLHCATPATP